MKKTRIKDIATQVGVSPSTVSIVLNNRFIERRISSKVVKAVQKAAKELGYVPDAAAQQMRSGRRRIQIALMTTYESPLVLVNTWLTSLDQYLSQLDVSDMTFAITLTPYHAGRLGEMLTNNHLYYHAAIIANTTPDDDRFLADYSAPVPIVLIGRRVPGYSTVRLDMEAAGKEVAKVLSDFQRDSLAVFIPAVSTQANSERINGFCQAAKELGLRDPCRVPMEGYSERAAFDAMQNFLEHKHSFNGLFALNDVCSIGAYHALKLKGLKIPGDVAVIGFDGLAFSPFLDPPLTTFETKRERIYSEAVRLLVQMFLGEFDEPVEMVFQTSLVLRESVKG